MVDTEIAYACLDIFIRNQRVAHVGHPAADSILNWLGRLDGSDVTKLVLMNRQGWLAIDINDEDTLTLCFCNNQLEIDTSEVVSRQTAAEKVLQFMEFNSPLD